MNKEKLDRLIERYTEMYFYATRRISAVIARELKDDITVDQYDLLRYIHRYGPCASSKLAERFHVNRSAITAMTNRLVSKTYIVRIADKADRRVVLLSATEAGRQVVERGEENIRHVVASYLQSLEEHEIETVIGVYEKIIGAIRSRMGGNEP